MTGMTTAIQRNWNLSRRLGIVIVIVIVIDELGFASSGFEQIVERDRSCGGHTQLGPLVRHSKASGANSDLWRQFLIMRHQLQNAEGTALIKGSHQAGEPGFHLSQFDLQRFFLIERLIKRGVEPVAALFQRHCWIGELDVHKASSI